MNLDISFSSPHAWDKDIIVTSITFSNLLIIRLETINIVINTLSGATVGKYKNVF
jgi:hypothetical protein